jgi:hypothetical protein
MLFGQKGVASETARSSQDKRDRNGIHYPIALPNLKAYAYLKHNGGDFRSIKCLAENIFIADVSGVARTTNTFHYRGDKKISQLKVNKA